MKRILIILVFGLIYLSSAAKVFSQASASHTVTVTVTAINEVALSGGNISLSVNTADSSGQPVEAIDNSTCDLKWTSTKTAKKITVATNVGSPAFTLKVIAQNVSGGTAASEVTLSTSTQDFVTGIAATKGRCNLGYTLSATSADGTGSDVHIVTFTLTDI